MKKLGLLTLMFLLSFNANAAFREILCTVKLDGKVEDQSLIYVNPGPPTTTRFSINNGQSELFVIVAHKPIGPSQITVHGLNPSAPKSSTAASKTKQQIRMADLKTTSVSIPVILTKLNNRQAVVDCKGMK